MNLNKKFLLDDDFIKWRLFQTEELNTRWKTYRTQNPQMEPILDKAIEDFNALKLNHHQMNEHEKSSIYNLIIQEIARDKKKRKTKRFLQFTTSAAAILLVALVTFFFLDRQKSEITPETTLLNTIIGQTLPEEDIVIISGDQMINIANNTNIKLTKNAKAVVTDSIQQVQEVELSQETINQLVVPFGRRSRLTLADGSSVWVNAGSQIGFPSEFRGDKREITVNGEIFINVMQDRSKPFIVHTSEMDIQVFGTSFNISAYDNDAIKSIVLVEGDVSVISKGANTRLKPNEKAELKNGEISTETVNVSEYISWTKDVLEFNETSVSEILKKIGRYYNVHFENDEEVELNNKTCSGKLFLSNNLDSVMTSISHITSTNYIRERNKIFIN